MHRIFCLTFFLISIAQAGIAEDVRVATRDEFVRALRAAKPGTTILVSPGKYAGGLSQARLRGTKESPIVIAGADVSDPPIIEGGGSGLHLSSPEDVELRNLVFTAATGNGLNIDDGGSVDTPANHVTLKNLVVRDVGPRGNRDGIKLSGLADFRIDGCRVERWGSSGSGIDMVGCHRGVVTGCTFKDAGGDQANGVQTKGGSSEIVIQRCRFENAGGRAVNVGGSTGLAYFRPTDAKHEAKDITVEDCEFLGGMSAISFVGVDGAIVRNNTIYRPRRWPIRILQENTDERFVPSRNGRFEKNVVVFRSDEVREVVNIGDKTAPETFTFVGNHWHCLDRPEATERLLRLAGEGNRRHLRVDPGLKNAEEGDLAIPGRQPGQAGVRKLDEK